MGKDCSGRPPTGCMSSDESLELSESQKSSLSTGIAAEIIPGCFLMLYVRLFIPEARKGKAIPA